MDRPVNMTLPDIPPSPPCNPGFSLHDQEAIRELLTCLGREGRETASEYVLSGAPFDRSCLLRRPDPRHGYDDRLINHHSSRILFAPEGWNGEVAHRLGEVLSLQIKVHGGTWPQSLAGKLNALAALATLTEEHLVRSYRHIPGPPPEHWLLTGPRCQELLALECGDPAALLELLFSPFHSHHLRRQLRFRKLLAMQELGAPFERAPERTLAGLRALRPQDRGCFLQLLRHSPLMQHRQVQEALLEMLLQDGRAAAEEALRALLLQREARELMTEAQARRLTARSRKRLEQGLRLLPLFEAAGADRSCPVGTYISLTGERIAIPPAPPLPPDTPRPEQLMEQLSRALNNPKRDCLRRLSEGGDLRPIFDACAPTGLDAATFLRKFLLLAPKYAPLDLSPLWQAAAEHLEVIDEALGSAQKNRRGRLRALRLLLALPAVPARYTDILLDLAVSPASREGRWARKLLSQAPDVSALIDHLLESKEEMHGLAAVRWMRERGAGIPLLREACSRNTMMSVRWALLDALMSRAGTATEHYCDLLRQEESRSRRDPESSPVFFLALDRLPALTWADGRAVPPELLRWWALRAWQLRDVRGPRWLRDALGRLAPAAAGHLSLWVLAGFLAYDLRFCRQKWEGPPATLHEAVAIVARWRCRGTYAGTSIVHRGVLALARGIRPDDAVALVHAYIRNHIRRHTQCELLLDTLALTPAPRVLRFLLAIASRGHRTRLVNHAREVIRTLAIRRGWDPEELADRGASLGGLDEQGVRRIAFGEQTLTVRLGASLTAEICDEQGRRVNRLRATDEATQEAQDEVNALRRRLRQQVKHQAARLQKAMAAERRWTPDVFQQHLLPHPILGRLCQLLVFARLDAQGRLIGTFRPTEEGCVDADHATVDIADCAAIRLVRRMSGAGALAWQEHFQDYRMVPLFAQIKGAYVDPVV